VDVNEDNVALTALSEDGVGESLVIDFPGIKFERHRYFTMRKRVQNAREDSIHDTLEGREERFVRDRLHKVSRHIVEWSRQFEKPCIVFEDLKETRQYRLRHADEPTLAPPPVPRPSVLYVVQGVVRGDSDCAD